MIKSILDYVGDSSQKIVLFLFDIDKVKCFLYIFLTYEQKLPKNVTLSEISVVIWPFMITLLKNQQMIKIGLLNYGHLE